jgi:hypothetical protein
VAAVTRRRRRTSATLARLMVFDVLSHQRLARWLVLPAPAFLAAWVAADELDRLGVGWMPGDLLGAVLTVPIYTAFLLGLPILLLTADLPLRQLDDGDASLTFTRVGSRAMWWAAKLLAMAVVAFAASAACLAVVTFAGVVRSGSLSLLPGPALAALFELDVASTPASRTTLVVASPLLLTFAVLPLAAVAATVGTATRRLGVAGITAVLLPVSALFTIRLDEVLPIAVIGLLPGGSVLLPNAIAAAEFPTAAFLLGSVGWLAAAMTIGVGTIKDLR